MPPWESVSLEWSGLEISQSFQKLMSMSPPQDFTKHSFFMIHHDSCTLSSHSIKIWSPVFLPFRLKYLAGSWCSTFNWVGREMAFWTSPWSLKEYSRERQRECRDAMTPVSFWRYPVFSHGDLPTDNHSAEQDAEERLPTPRPEHNLTVLLLLNMGCNPLLLS